MKTRKPDTRYQITNDRYPMANDLSIKLKKVAFQIIIVLILLVVVSPSQTIQLYITGNINGAVADCLCGDSKNGSLARLSTFYGRTYQSKQIWVDAGNFLTSYKFSEHNSFFLDYYSQLKYDMICLGEQEFVHGDDFFLKTILTKFSDKLIFTNFPQNNTNIKSVKKIRRNGINFYFLNIWSENHLDLIKFLPVNKTIEAEVKKHKLENELIVLFLQGDVEKAEQILKIFPFIVGIIVGNNQEDFLLLNLTNKSFILSPGIEAEKIGFVELTLGDKKIINIKAELIDLREVAEEDTVILNSFNQFNETLK